MFKPLQEIKAKYIGEKFFLTVINFLLRLIPIFFIMIASRKLLVEDYASYRKFYIIFEAALPLLSFGLSKTVFNILNEKNIFQTINLILIISLSSTFFFTTIFFSLKIVFPQIFPYEIGGLAVFFAIFTQIPVYIILSIRLKMDLFIRGILNKYWFLLLTLLTFSIAWNTTEINILLYSRSGLNLGLILLLLPANWPKQFNLKVGKVFKDFRKQSLLIPLSLFLSSLFLFIDKFIVAYLLDDSTYAVFINGAIELPLIAVIISAYSSILLRDVRSFIKVGNFHNASRYIIKISQETLLICLLLYTLGFIFSHEILTILYENYNDQTLRIFKNYLFLLPARTLLYGPLFVAFNQGKSLLIRTLYENVFAISMLIICSYYNSVTLMSLPVLLVTYIFIIPYNLLSLKKWLRVKKIDFIDYKGILIGFAGLFGITEMLNYLLDESLIAKLVSLIICLIFIKVVQKYLRFA